MKRLILFILLLPCSAFGQRKLPPCPPTKEEAEISDAYYKCLHTNEFNTMQRRTFYPFNITKNVKLISFNDPNVYINYLPVKHHILNTNKVREIKALSNSGIDSLTDVLYNIGYTPMKGGLEIVDPGGKCYNPRNAILFMNSKGKVIEYIELCFQCHKIVFSSKK